MTQRVLSFKKKTKLSVEHAFKVVKQSYCVLTPFCWGGGGNWGVEPPTKFSKKGGLDRTSTFRGDLLGKRGVKLFRGLQFSH